ncbi:hypothetical protein BaRGS_00031963 [Batillaria attramentaria]|uniref:Uncharacterized protein n=1 Tax=Batillaria attramentaria TaxID=370345 RepID=A0ABD0JPM7_9CAEN
MRDARWLAIAKTSVKAFPTFTISQSIATKREKVGPDPFQRKRVAELRVLLRHPPARSRFVASQERNNMASPETASDVMAAATNPPPVPLERMSKEHSELWANEMTEIPRCDQMRVERSFCFVSSFSFIGLEL